MAVQNTLAKKKETSKNEVIFEANGTKVTLSPEIVRNYLVSGDKERVTMQEVVMFINLCRYNGLNPWLKEAYCIKYGNEPATIVPSKDAFMKRAETSPQFDGYRAGVVVCDEENGVIERREGSMVLKNETLIGGFAEVFRKDREHSYISEVSFDEYAGRKKDGSLNRQWSSKPGTMIRKVALVQALREAFPQVMSGTYFAEEQGVAEPIEAINYAQQPVDIPDDTGDPAPALPQKNERADMIHEAVNSAADPVPVSVQENKQMSFFE